MRKKSVHPQVSLNLLLNAYKRVKQKKLQAENCKYTRVKDEEIKELKHENELLRKEVYQIKKQFMEQNMIK
jgi:hypothetical protein